MKTLLSLLVSLSLSAGLYAQSFDDYRAAAESGDPVAVSNAGVCFLHGWGVEQNHAEALKCFRQAAGHDVPAAYYNLGLCYEKGWGLPQDFTQAVACYRRAAEQGDPDAQRALGNCYFSGQGVGRDYAQAVVWLRKAAAQNDGCAQYNLGVCYANGFGVVRDYAAAVKWYTWPLCRAIPTDNTISGSAISMDGVSEWIVPKRHPGSGGLPNRIMRAPSITSAYVIIWGVAWMPTKRKPAAGSPPRPKRAMPMLSGHCASSIDPVPRPGLSCIPVVSACGFCLRGAWRVQIQSRCAPWAHLLSFFMVFDHPA